MIQPTRRVPLPLMAPLKETINKLESDGIIEKKEGPSEWVNALVIVRKPDASIRKCMDPIDINDQIELEPRQIPNIEETFGKVNGATIFSKLDGKSRFYQVPLDEESSELCTIGTPFGRYKFKRLPFGIKTAAEVFHHRFKEIFDMEGVEVYIDDILVHGKTKIEHDERLKKVFEKAKENGVKFNKKKMSFWKKSDQFHRTHYLRKRNRARFI